MEFIDKKQHDKLVELGGFELLESMIVLFNENAFERLEVIKNAFKTNDYSSAERAAHSLKSSSFFLGCKKISKICEKLEISFNEEKTENAMELAELLEIDLKKTVSALNEILKEHQ